MLLPPRELRMGATRTGMVDMGMVDMMDMDRLGILTLTDMLGMDRVDMLILMRISSNSNRRLLNSSSIRPLLLLLRIRMEMRM